MKCNLRIFQLLVLCAANLISARVRADEAIPVRVDTRVELLAIVFRLAGSFEYNQPSSKSPYADEVERYFGAYRSHQAVQTAANLRATAGISFDAVMSFAVHLRSDRLEPKIPFTATPFPLESRWKPDTAVRFLKELRRFVADTGSDRFFATHKSYYEKAAAGLTAELVKRPYRTWFDSFFGAKPKASFTAIVGLLNGGGNYGMAVRYPDGREEILPIIGAGRFNSTGLPVFGEETAELVVHEFSHSYTNPFVDRWADKLLPSAETIFPYREELMRQQAYGNPKTMLYESLVRACTVRFMRDNESTEVADRQLKSEQARGFLWTGELVELLGKYEKDRGRYPAFPDIMPEIVALFSRTAGSIRDLMAKLPRVLSTSPANGDKLVDPAIAEIRIEFDRPMKTDSYAIVGNPADVPRPATTPAGSAKPYFTADGKTFVLPVKLEPGKTYTFSVNSIYRSGFVSTEGVPLDPVLVDFSTMTR